MDTVWYFRNGSRLQGVNILQTGFEALPCHYLILVPKFAVLWLLRASENRPGVQWKWDDTTQSIVPSRFHDGYFVFRGGSTWRFLLDTYIRTNKRTPRMAAGGFYDKLASLSLAAHVVNAKMQVQNGDLWMQCEHIFVM